MTGVYIARNTKSGYIFSIILAFAGCALAAGFKHLLGAPNYSLGIVTAVTLACYLYGLAPAVLCFLLATTATVLLLFSPAGSFAVVSEEWMKVITLFLTSAVTCTLVTLLRNSERLLSHQKHQIEEQNEVLQRQNEEIHFRNEDLHILTDELHETKEQLIQALQHETRIAQTLQKAFLPNVPDRFGNLSIAATYVAGSNEAEIGGDFYDIFELSNGYLAIAIGDASGKGINAARQAVSASYGLRFSSAEIHSPAECLCKLNSFLTNEQSFSGFVTLFYGILDPRTSRFTYCSGGHEPPIVFRESTNETIVLEPNGRFIGIVSKATFHEDTIQLEKGDKIFLFTDGLTEARGECGFLGPDGLEKILTAEANTNHPRETLQRIIGSAQSYAGGRFNDDVAAVLISVS